MFKEIQTSNLRPIWWLDSLWQLAIGLASASASAQTGFTSINVTGAGTGAQQGTAVTAVDAAGDIAGIYVDTNNALHCFVLPAGGSIANCDVSGAGSSVGEGTFPTTINTSGVVAGSYVDANQISHGFVRAVNGTITKFDAPLASQSKNRGTTVREHQRLRCDHWNLYHGDLFHDLRLPRVHAFRRWIDVHRHQRSKCGNQRGREWQETGYDTRCHECFRSDCRLLHRFQHRATWFRALGQRHVHRD